MGAKYLFVINSFGAGGAERSLLDLLPRLVEEGVTPIVACLRYRDVGFEEEVRGSGFDVRLLSGKGRLGKIRSLRRLIGDEQPDLVYTALFDADLAGRLAAIGRRVPVMSNLANTAYDPVRLADPNVTPFRLRMVRWIDGVTARHLTDHFHAVSEAVKDSTVETLGVPADRISVVKRGRDGERLGERTPERRATMRRRLGIDDDAEVIVTVGRQEYQKGHRHLIEAFAGVVAARPQARLLIAGREGHATVELRTLVSTLGLESSVTMLGHRDDVPDVMAAADLFVFPSVYEGLGGALIEALALSLPVVASDLAALREVVVAGENAELVPAGDADALRTVIVSLLGDEPRLARYGQRSRERFEAEFRSEDAAVRMLALLAEVSGSGGSGGDGAETLDDAGVTDLLEAMHDRRKAVAADQRWAAAGSWRSFKADFIQARAEDAREIAIKFGDGWTGDDAHYVADEVERVRGLLKHLPGGKVRVPSALGWSEEPAAVALRFVDGVNLFPALADPSHPVWEGGPEAFEELAVRCGQAIGAYHAAEPAAEDDEATKQEALEDLSRAARRAGVRRRTVLAVAPRLLRARGYRFSGNDVTIDRKGHLVMLDPPHVKKFDYIHRDVSGFTFDLHRWLIGQRPLHRDHPNAELVTEVSRAFLAGYAATGPSALDAPLDRWMIRLYEVSRITGRAYGELRSRQLRTVPGLLRWAAQTRRSMGPPPQ